MTAVETISRTAISPNIIAIPIYVTRSYKKNEIFLLYILLPVILFQLSKHYWIINSYWKAIWWNIMYTLITYDLVNTLHCILNHHHKEFYQFKKYIMFKIQLFSMNSLLHRFYKISNIQTTTG